MMSLDELTFEVERFSWQGEERLEVRGRWFGVRGQRFMRPTLHVNAGGRRKRMIAILDHKPWAPDAEGQWIAVFTWRGPVEPITAARLEVSPDIVLELGEPGSLASGSTLSPRPRPKRERAEPKPFMPPPKPASPAATPDLAPPLPATPDAATPDLAPALPATSDETSLLVTSPGPIAPPPTSPGAASPPAATPAAAPPPDPEAVARAEEAMERARMAAELELARRQLESLAGHHESAVARANEVVRLEGELRAAEAARDEAIVRAQAAEAARDEAATRAAARADEAEAARNAAATRADEAEAARDELVASAHDDATARTDAALARAERAEAERDAALARADELAAAASPDATVEVAAAELPDAGTELAAALERAERAEARANDLAASIRRGERAAEPEPLGPPHERQVKTGPGAPHREWSPTERYATVGLIVVAAVCLLIVALTLL